ncbi:hypothetical protein F4801DRAFT_584809 [Xylaria longipes]|nr:hypothetical protein F4801DRAFT_584809 [Xylaria longipes]
MAHQRSYLIELPPELLKNIVDQLDEEDVVSVVMLSQHFRSFFFDYWFHRQFISRVRRLEQNAQFEAEEDDETVDTSKKTEEFPVRICWSLLRHALLVDSPWIMRHIKTCRNELDLDESLALRETMENCYLYLAISQDAPMIVAWLLESQAEKIPGLVGQKHHPKLTPFCLALSKSNASKQEDLDASLMTAYTHLLPRTVKLLLDKGANPNAYNGEELKAVHSHYLARQYHLVASYALDTPISWIGDIITALVAHGSDIDSSTGMMHTDGCHICLDRFYSTPECFKVELTRVDILILMREYGLTSYSIACGRKGRPD